MFCNFFAFFFLFCGNTESGERRSVIFFCLFCGDRELRETKKKS
jgi:hypothetical protein